MGEYIYERPELPVKVVHDEWSIRTQWDFEQREQIVRCRDCREYNPKLYRHISCELLARYVKPNDFCAWGEKETS